MARAVGCTLAMFIGVVTVAIVVGLSAYLSGKFSLSVVEELPIFVIWAVMIAAPFGVLAIVEARDWQSWLVGLFLTAAFWGVVILDPYLRDGGGANIGLGLIMMLSPLVISGVCICVASARKDWLP